MSRSSRVLLSFFIIGLCALSVPCQAARSAGRMIILVDEKSKERTEFEKNHVFGIITHFLQQAIDEQAGPILVTASLFETFVRAKHEAHRAHDPSVAALRRLYAAVYKRKQLPALRAALHALPLHSEPQALADDPIVHDYARYALLGNGLKRSITGMPVANEAELVRIPFTHFSWSAYVDATAGYLLLVPRWYEQRMRKRAPAGASRDQALGLALSRLHPLELPADQQPGYQRTLSQLGSLMSEQPTGLTKQLLHKIFLPRIDDARAYNVEHSFFISGHGSIGSYASGRIAGLSQQAMNDLIVMCANRIFTHHVHYLTCFGHLYTLRDVARYPQPPLLNFTLSTGTIVDARIYAYLDAFELVADPKRAEIKIASPLKLEAYFGNLERSNVSLQRAIDAVSQVASLRLRNQDTISVPALLIPHLDWAQPVTVLPTVYRLTRTKVFAHRAEQRPLSIRDKRIVIMHPRYVPLKVSISDKAGRSPRFLSFIKGYAQHFIGWLRLEKMGVYASMIDSFGKALSRHSEKSYYIGSLKGGNDVAQRIVNDTATSAAVRAAVEPYRHSEAIELTHVVISSLDKRLFITFVLGSSMVLHQEIAFDMRTGKVAAAGPFIQRDLQSHLRYFARSVVAVRHLDRERLLGPHARGIRDPDWRAIPAALALSVRQRLRGMKESKQRQGWRERFQRWVGW